MRKLKLMIQTTINGFTAGRNGENDWMTWNPDPEFLAFMNSQYDTSSTLLLGRKTADFFIPYWIETFSKTPDVPFARKIVEMPKVVFSKTLGESKWDNTSVANKNCVDEIANLKNQDGKDILIIGSPGFVSSLIKEDLIDEYLLIVNPTAMNDGKTIFNALDGIRRLNPVDAKLFQGGKIALTYNQKKD